MYKQRDRERCGNLYFAGSAVTAVPLLRFIFAYCRVRSFRFSGGPSEWFSILKEEQ